MNLNELIDFFGGNVEPTLNGPVPNGAHPSCTSFFGRTLGRTRGTKYPKTRRLDPSGKEADPGKRVHYFIPAQTQSRNEAEEPFGTSYFTCGNLTTLLQG
jgi:hypothetical protein